MSSKSKQKRTRKTKEKSNQDGRRKTGETGDRRQGRTWTTSPEAAVAICLGTKGTRTTQAMLSDLFSPSLSVCVRMCVVVVSVAGLLLLTTGAAVQENATCATC